jgi:hypothetical protein
MLLLLAPFALVGQLTSDSYGFAAARVAWMLLGALNAVLIWRIVRPIGLVAALFGALSYAVFYPAVYADHTTLQSPRADHEVNTLGALAVHWFLIGLLGSSPRRLGRTS